MKRQFLREAHARQDKVQKPDYREEIALDGDSLDRGGIDRPCFKPLFTVKGNTITFDVNRPSFKTKAQEYLEHILRREYVFKIDGYLASLNWGKKAFCRHNRVDKKVADAVFDSLLNQLEELFKITINNLRRVERETGWTWIEKEGKPVALYQFKSGFVPTKDRQLEGKDFILEIDFINTPKRSNNG